MGELHDEKKFKDKLEQFEGHFNEKAEMEIPSGQYHSWEPLQLTENKTEQKTITTSELTTENIVKKESIVVSLEKNVGYEKEKESETTTIEGPTTQMDITKGESNDQSPTTEETPKTYSRKKNKNKKQQENKTVEVKTPSSDENSNIPMEVKEEIVPTTG